MKRCRCCISPRRTLKAFVALAHLLGTPSRRFEWWAWEMTPMPMGFPSWRQYAEGLRFFLRGLLRGT